MSIQVNGNFVHWNYFVALEQDLGKVSRFVEFSEDNFNVYSIELAHLLLAASSEVDVVLKALCKLKAPAKEHRNINDYKETIKATLPSLIAEKAFIHRFGLELRPWSNWSGEENPLWWRSYNNVKHQRDLYFREANLRYTLNAVVGLSLVVIYYYREVFSQENAHTFRDVTNRLRPETSLIDFDASYTYAHLVV